MTRPRRVAAVDLGTTKVCCVLADVASGSLRVLGVGEAPSRGIKKGLVVDIEAASEAVAEAVDAAEQMAGAPIDTAFVGLAGGHISSQSSNGVVAVGAGRREVRGDDVGRAIQAARAVSVAGDRRILHVLPRQFTVDGQGGVKDAIGMAGNRLEVETVIVTGASTAIQNVAKVMHEAGLDVEEFVMQVLASAEAVLTSDELERGAVVVDVGGSTTDVAVFHGGAVARTAVIPVGGSHVTSDLAVGLRCDLETAEAVKIAHGHCLQLTIPADATVNLTPMGYEQAVAVPQRYLGEIIGPRAREMAQLITAEIAQAGPPALFAGGIVLTGGGALLRGFVEVTQQVSELPARVGAPGGITGMDMEVHGPRHATVVGLLRWSVNRRDRALRRPASNGHARSNGHSGNGSSVNARFGRWLRELF